VSPQFTVDEPGAVEGLLFFDKDEDNVFDPSDGDYALSGVQLQIRVRGATDVLAGGNVTSDASGRFAVSNLPAGTHDAFVNAASLPAGVVLCSNPLPITVEPGVTRFYAFQTRGGCLVLISVAEAQPLGTVVVVRGIVTAAPGTIRSGYTYIQDASGGIRIFASSLEGQGIAVGDRIEVSGTLAAFNQDLQITSPTLRARDPAFGSVAPTALTTAAVAAAGDAKNALVGTLVRITTAQVAGYGTGSNAINATVNDGSGATQVRIERGLAATDAAAQALMGVGKCYNVTGALGTFNGTAQVFPRTVADIVEVPCT
ncbi:MAG TPA: DUF5689 domain-containing protein, partial [Longimicrobium sp.]|nr:DUF5689 domain-containing protein [Longimicrobium sp.]